MPSPTVQFLAPASRREQATKKLQMRNLQRKFIGSSFGRSEYPVAPRRLRRNELV